MGFAAILQVGGRISLFVGKWQVVTRQLFRSVRSKERFSDFSSKSFSGGPTESHRDPAGSRSDPSYPRGDTRFDFEERDRSNKRFSESLFVSDFRYPQEVWGSSGHFEPQGVQICSFPSQHFRMETLNVILPQLSASDWAVSIDLKDAYLHVPIHPSSRRFLGFSVHGQDLPIQGFAVRPQGFALGVYESGGHSCGPSSSIGSSSLLLSGRLASCSRIQGPGGVPSSYNPAMDSGPGVPGKLGEVFPYPAETPVLSWGATRHSEVVGSTLRAQSVGSPGGDSGSCQGSFGYRPLVAEISRPPLPASWT